MTKTVIKGKIARFGFDEVTIKGEPHFIRWLAQYKDKDLSVEFKEYKSNRTLNQNALLWKIIGLIDQAENGRPSEDGEMAVYANLIKSAKISTANFETTPQAYQEVLRRELFRHTEVLYQDDEAVVWIGYYGSSTFDTAEMNLLIDTAKDYAAKLNIYLEG